HAEAQRISLPKLVLHRDHPSEVTAGAAQALGDTADSLGLSETMANNDGYGVAHGNCNCVVCTCVRAVMIERRSRHPGVEARRDRRPVEHAVADARGREGEGSNRVSPSALHQNLTPSIVV